MSAVRAGHPRIIGRLPVPPNVNSEVKCGTAEGDVDVDEDVDVLYSPVRYVPTMYVLDRTYM